MGLLFRSAAAFFSTSATPTVIVPNDVVAGDRLYIVTAGINTPSATPPIGWALVAGPLGGFWQWAVYSKFASGTLGSISSDAGGNVGLSYSGAADVQSAIYAVCGGAGLPIITSIYSNSCALGVVSVTATAGDLILNYGSTRPNHTVLITLSRGTTDAARSADTNSGSVIGHESPVAGPVLQTFSPNYTTVGTVGRAYLVLRLVQTFTDNFANAGVLTVTNLPQSAIDTSAWTTEVSEPGGMAHSGWAKFTPTTTGPHTISTLGSNFDTMLAIYIGSALNNLVQVAADDNSGGSGTSRISVVLNAGTAYYIQIGSVPAGLGGLLLFQLSATSSMQLGAINLELLGVGQVSTRLSALSVDVLGSGIAEVRLGQVNAEVIADYNSNKFVGWDKPI